MNTTRSSTSIFYSQIFSGIGIGILLGVIMGLSISPVVKTILGALAGLLVAFLGLQENLFAKQGEEDQEKITNRIFINSIRAGSFGMATVIGLFLGMYLRTHEVLSLSKKQQVKNWTDAGFNDSLAEELVIYQNFKLFKRSGLLHIDTKLAEIAAQKIDPNSGFLMSKEEMKNYCISLDVEKRYNNSAQNALEGYEGDAKLIAYAKELSAIPEVGQLEIMNSVKNLICFLGNGTDDDYKEFCNDIQKNINYSNINFSLDEIASSSNIREMGLVANAILRHAISEKDKTNLTKAILAITCE